MSGTGPGDVWTPPQADHPARAEPTLPAWVRVIAGWYLLLAAATLAIPWTEGHPPNPATLIGCGVLGLPAFAVLAAPTTFVRLLVIAACLQTGLAIPATIASGRGWIALAAIAAIAAPIPLLILARARLQAARSRRRLEELAEEAASRNARGSSPHADTP